ncbi:Nif3-like dinuclear metal center hexameric protein [uncultured Mucilaginibacter sp.]|uniref:Nif3-like dinuclear metal center hexameric protein n=1 Tax=uncultured Mucilaginibacter sp. TaxID=797541 RepID=UPI0026020C01|nr:Nif3-like dinuclear metal center hexameric protein [uncultured Mucilaginibacter sp.]
MKLNTLTAYLESLAPLNYQEDYDNSGLLIGHADQEISQALISLDCTEAVVDEAIAHNCQLVISHHPIIFKGLKKFNGKTYVERVVEKAIKNSIAIYAIHTNLDHVAAGVNKKIADKLSLKNCQILSPKKNLLKKLVTFVPIAQAEKVREALFEAGSGSIGNYSECSFNVSGTGTYKAGKNTNPFAGEQGIQHQEEEVRIETVFPINLESKVLTALFLAHPYEEVAYDLYPITNQYQEVGAGLIGELESPQEELPFLHHVKTQMKAEVVRHTSFTGKKVVKVAVCGGSGSFLLKDAIRAGADVFVTADFKYHEFFDAEGKLVIADIGHFETEQFTQELLAEIISKKFPTFAIRLTKINTNPVKYIF